MTNEDVIDLFDRVKEGATVVVLAPGQRGWVAFRR
jgi:lipoprotein-anchoring transpeptidase ErfK/SrfK